MMSNSLVLIVFALVVSISAMILLNRYLKLHAFFGLLIASLILGLITGKSFREIIEAMQAGFGSLLQHIGLVVALGSCLGVVLEKTGAMETISQKLVHFFGERRSVLSMSVIGFIVGIPVFCDSGFIILSRLIPSIAAKASVPGASLGLALSSGLYTTHTLVPPTPGPLAAAVSFGLADHMGQSILVGVLGGIPVSLVAYFFAKRIGRNIVVTGISSQNETRQQRSALKSFLPLIVPIILITISTLPKTLGITGLVSEVLTVAGMPVISLMIGLLISCTLISPDQKTEWPAWISEALKDAGIILLIIGAGGGFGFVIRMAGVDVTLKEYITSIEARGIVFMVTGFLIAAILKTAQGSTTSSMIITSSLLAPLATSAGFTTPTQLSILVVAVGGGAMTVSHANDAYFWVISQFGGFTTRDTFRSHTLITLVQGVTALITAVILFLLL
jgi:gluconate:H+ symporter, GntP family